VKERKKRIERQEREVQHPNRISRNGRLVVGASSRSASKTVNPQAKENEPQNTSNAPAAHVLPVAEVPCTNDGKGQADRLTT